MTCRSYCRSPRRSPVDPVDPPVSPPLYPPEERHRCRSSLGVGSPVSLPRLGRLEKERATNDGRRRHDYRSAVAASRHQNSKGRPMGDQIRNPMTTSEPRCAKKKGEQKCMTTKTTISCWERPLMAELFRSMKSWRMPV